jgi:hypothetical protein
MTTGLSPLLAAICFFGFASSVFAQFDAAAFATGLREKYGPPLLRETFELRPGIEMVVDYAANGHVCRIQLPAVAPLRDRQGVIGPAGVDDFLEEILPPLLRGKEPVRGAMATGAPHVQFVESENLLIARSFQAAHRTGITVTFTKEACRNTAQP